MYIYMFIYMYIYMFISKYTCFLCNIRDIHRDGWTELCNSADQFLSMPPVQLRGSPKDPPSCIPSNNIYIYTHIGESHNPSNSVHYFSLEVMSV